MGLRRPCILTPLGFPHPQRLGLMVGVAPVELPFFMARPSPTPHLFVRHATGSRVWAQTRSARFATTYRNIAASPCIVSPVRPAQLTRGWQLRHGSARQCTAKGKGKQTKKQSKAFCGYKHTPVMFLRVLKLPPPVAPLSPASPLFILARLLPVPHPIVIRKYHPNQHTAIWFTAFMWGVVFVRNQELPMFDGQKIRLFTVTSGGA